MFRAADLGYKRTRCQVGKNRSTGIDAAFDLVRPLRTAADRILIEPHRHSTGHEIVAQTQGKIPSVATCIRDENAAVQ